MFERNKTYPVFYFMYQIKKTQNQTHLRISNYKSNKNYYFEKKFVFLFRFVCLQKFGAKISNLPILQMIFTYYKVLYIYFGIIIIIVLEFCP